MVAETSRRWRVPRPTRPAGTVQSERGGRRRGVISNTGDMTWFYRALLGGQLLKPAQLAQMRTTVRATEPDPVWPGARYGLGLMESPLTCGGTYYGHAGDLPGYSTRDGVSADGRDVVVLEATGDGSTGDPSTEEANNALIDQQLCAAEAE
ncbi:serine hydrolase [Streptomyces niveus]